MNKNTVEQESRTHSTPPNALDCGMDNVLAWRLGEIASNAGDPLRSGVGDQIDRGLILRRLLEEKGFFIIYREPGSAASTQLASTHNGGEGKTSSLDTAMSGTDKKE